MSAPVLDRPAGSGPGVPAVASAPAVAAAPAAAAEGAPADRFAERAARVAEVAARHADEVDRDARPPREAIAAMR
ncbi:hypothetical protein [Curtobacterium citreum]